MKALPNSQGIQTGMLSVLPITKMRITQLLQRILAPLLEKEPNRISYVVTQAEILTEQNESGQAIDIS